LASAHLGYALALAVGALTVGHTPIGVPLAAVAVAGACGPLLTGGLSSRLAGIAGPGERAQRRAQGLDAVTYGLGGTVGPGVVAGLAAVADPLVALLGLCAAAVIGAGLTLTLPSDPPPGPRPVATTGVRAGLALLLTVGPLRRVTVMAVLDAVGMGVMPLAAVALGTTLAGRPGAGAMLGVAAGIGALAGSLTVTVLPLRGEPEVLARRLFVLVMVLIAGSALAPEFALALVGYGLIGAAGAMAFTATLAARSSYAPPSARAQVFVTSAGLKVAMASAGSALAGVGIGLGLGGRALLLASAAATAIGVLIAVIDAALERRRVGAAPITRSASAAARSDQQPPASLDRSAEPRSS
jgi:hypothetical protein